MELLNASLPSMLRSWMMCVGSKSVHLGALQRLCGLAGATDSSGLLAQKVQHAHHLKYAAIPGQHQTLHRDDGLRPVNIRFNKHNIVPSASYGFASSRSFSTSHTSLQQQQAASIPVSKVATANDVLNQIHIIKLRGNLDIEADHSLHIPYERFVEIAKESGAISDEQVTESFRILQKAGIILRHGDIVYLRAEEIADMVMLMLPGGRDDAAAKLSKVEAELADLDQIHEQVERRSHRLVNALLVGGLVVLTTQFVAFIYLTWWELSWDVMEPIAYIIGLFYSLVAYMYFLTTRHTFDLEPVQEFWAKRFKNNRIAKLQFDSERYEYLRKVAERYKRHLAHTRIRA